MNDATRANSAHEHGDWGRSRSEAPRANGPERHRRILALIGGISACFVATSANAQQPPATNALPTAASNGADSAQGAAPSDESDVREEARKRYYFLGLRFRDIVVPQFLTELFTTGGGTANVWLVGPELSTRKDGIEIDVALSYADYGFGPALFKGKDDGDIAYERVTSNLKVVYLTFDLLYEIPLEQKGRFSLLIGGGIGIGAVADKLYRAQVYPNVPGDIDPNDPKKWTDCSGANDPQGGAFCDAGNQHFGNFDEPSWADGGSKPIVIPWLSLPQVSFRVKPIKQLQARLDLGFSVTGFYTGLSAGYGF